MQSNELRVFIRFTGRSREIDRYGVALTPDSADGEVKNVVARYLAISEDQLESASVERATYGFIVRPECVFE